MQLSQIEGFLEVARLGNVSRAATSLSITQPALSARIQALEEELGQPLFVRGRRGVRLTDVGRAFLPYAEQAVSALASGLALVGDLGAGGAGELVIGAAPAVGTYVLPHVLVRFAERYPNVRLVVRTGHSEEITELVVRSQVHLGLIRSISHPLVTARALYDDALVLVSGPGHPFAKQGSVKRERLSEAPLILFDPASSYHELTTALMRKAGVRPRGVMELDNIDAAKKMVAAGLGVALLPRTAVAEELASGALAMSTIKGASPGHRRIVVIRRSDAGEPQGALVDFLSLLDRIPSIVPGALPPAR